jgi:hypothetical protein
MSLFGGSDGQYVVRTTGAQVPLDAGNERVIKAVATSVAMGQEK